MSKLDEVQAELDAIQEKVIENKNARNDLRVEAKELRDQYIAKEKEREAALKEQFEGRAE